MANTNVYAECIDSDITYPLASYYIYWLKEMGVIIHEIEAIPIQLSWHLWHSVECFERCPQHEVSKHFVVFQNTNQFNILEKLKPNALQYLLRFLIYKIHKDKKKLFLKQFLWKEHLFFFNGVSVVCYTQHFV